MLFELADLLLPNSDLEAAQIVTDTGATTPMHVVPNAVDPNMFTPPPATVSRNGVLYVGRLEPHKNQLGLITELSGTGVPLTIVGPEHPHHEDYAKRCRAVADESVTFLGMLSGSRLRDAYRSALVHALPSWFETTGLVSLEAAATGCAIVTTNRGYAREYFQDFATYCDPGSKGSIRRAVELALQKPAPASLRNRILNNYTWDHTARATLAGYKLAIRSHLQR